MSLLILVVSLLGQNNTPIRMGVDASGLTIEEIGWFMDEGSLSVLFAKSVQPTNPYEGMYLWSTPEARLEGLRGLAPDAEIIVEASYAPRWVTGWYTDNGSFLPGEPNNRPVTDAYNDFYADQMGAMVLRWKPGGLNDFGITEWGLWNEPDGIGLMMGYQELLDTEEEPPYCIDPTLGYQAYHDVGLLCAERIRESDPNATIISGGFLQMSSHRPNPEGSFWLDNARNMTQTVFSGSASGNPVPIDWPIIPDVLHWHAYDCMQFDEDAPEFHYDPLVIDLDDLMYSERTDEIGPLMDNDWLIMPEYPYWQDVPQYSLEHSPNYSLEDWRTSNIQPCDVPADSFYTMWRANYFVTGNLLLMQSSRMTTIAPIVPRGDWWVDGWRGYEWSPISSGDVWREGDKAYRAQTRFIDGCLVSDFGTMGLSIPGVDVYQWEFDPPLSMNYSKVHALRTYRENPEIENYLPEDVIIVSLEVDPSTNFVRVFDMLGESPQDYDDIVNNHVDIPVSGYMEYALEYYSDRPAEGESFEIYLRVSRPNTGSLLFTIDNQVSKMIAYDISGRMVWSEQDRGDNPERPGLRDFLWRHAQSGIPTGCYLVIGCDSTGSILVSRKVVIR